MFKKIILLITFSVCTAAYSLPIILQIDLAEKWFQKVDKYTIKEKQAFILGSLICDIKYLDSINNTFEVDSSVTLSDVYSTSDPFEAGKKFHSYIETQRDQLVEKWGVFRHLTVIPSDQTWSFLMLLEDELLYNPKLSMQGSSYLSSISEGEILSGIKIEKIAIWHGVLYKYLGAKPSSVLLSLKNDKRLRFPISSEGVEEWKAALVFFSSNEKLKTYLEDLRSVFETSFEIFQLKFLKK